jgi:hypothetical protein
VRQGKMVAQGRKVRLLHRTFAVWMVEEKPGARIVDDVLPGLRCMSSNMKFRRSELMSNVSDARKSDADSTILSMSALK